MLFKNNLTPAYATAGYQASKSESSSKKDGVSFATADGDFESYASNSNGGAKKKAPQNSAPQKGAPQKNGRKKQKASINFKPIIFAIIAVIAVVIVIAIIVAIANAPGSNMKKSDAVYTSFQDANGSWRIAVDGEVLEDIVFTNEIELEVASNNTFAYIIETLETSYQRIHILEGDELVTSKRDAKEILEKSLLTPCVIYRNTDVADTVYCFKGEKDETPITPNVNADNFVIVPDGSAVYYTIPAADGTGIVLQRFKNAVPNDVAPNFIPIATSADGEYVYVTSASEQGFAYFDMSNEEEPSFLQVKGINDKIYSNDTVKGITAINVDGDQVVLATTKGDGNITSYFYEAGDETATAIGTGLFTSCHFDSGVLFEDTLLDSYFTVDNSYAPNSDENNENNENNENEEENATDASTITTCYLNSKKECVTVATTQGSFSPDGKYFYYIDPISMGLKRVSLSSKTFDKHENMPPNVKIVNFFVTEKGDLYVLTNETENSKEDVLSLYFIDGSTTPNPQPLSAKVDVDSVSLAVNTLYYTESATDEATGNVATVVYSSTNGSNPATAEFENYNPTIAPKLDMGAGKQGYATFSTPEGDKLFYTSDGKSFDFLCDALSSADQTN